MKAIIRGLVCPECNYALRDERGTLVCQTPGCKWEGKHYLIPHVNLTPARPEAVKTLRTK